MPAHLPKLADLKAMAPDFAEAAQRIYDEWDQDEDGLDVELGAGGICDRIADAIVSRVCHGFGGDVQVASNLLNTEQHVVVVIALQEGVYEVDIPYAIYERGAAFRWTKIPDVRFSGGDVEFLRLSPSPADFWMFSEDGGPDGPPEAGPPAPFM